jgi:hypothetical protein
MSDKMTILPDIRKNAMSDGPHRSLPMRAGWKRTAERADKPAYSAAEVADAICRAVEDDWRAEIPESCTKSLSQILGNQQLSLLDDASAAQFAAVRRSLSGWGSLGGVLIDCAEEAAARGKFGEDALRDAVRNALADRVLRNVKQVEEHYHRNSPQRGINIRERLDEAVTGVSFDTITRRVLQVGDRPEGHRRKQQGLDDGVPLP